MDIRLAREDDFPALLVLIDAFVAEQVSVGEANQRDYILLAARHGLNTNQAVVVAEEDYELCGYVIWTAFPGAAKGEVLGAGTYIKPEHRGKGLGTKLQHFAQDHLFAMGYEYITGAVSRHNQSALNMISASGAEITGYTIKWSKPCSSQSE